MRPHLGKMRHIWAICTKSGQKCSRMGGGLNHFCSVSFLSVRFCFFCWDLLHQKALFQESLDDLVTSRNKIGLLNLQFETGWMKNWTNIQKGSGYPVCSGEVVHASATRQCRHMLKWDVIYSAAINYEQWLAAMGGTEAHLVHKTHTKTIWFLLHKPFPQNSSHSMPPLLSVSFASFLVGV